MVMGQSIVLSEIKTEVSLDCDDPTNQDLLLQQNEDRIEKLSQQDKLSKFCMDAGFLGVVEIGQYFMTKDTGDLTQFHAVPCREYTLPREDDRKTQKLDPCWELRPVETHLQRHEDYTCFNTFLGSLEPVYGSAPRTSPSVRNIHTYSFSFFDANNGKSSNHSYCSC